MLATDADGACRRRRYRHHRRRHLSPSSAPATITSHGSQPGRARQAAGREQRMGTSHTRHTHEAREHVRSIIAILPTEAPPKRGPGSTAPKIVRWRFRLRPASPGKNVETTRACSRGRQGGLAERRDARTSGRRWSAEGDVDVDCLRCSYLDGKEKKEKGGEKKGRAVMRRG